MSKKISPSVILVDGSSYLYRAFHVPALQKLSTAKGQPTGAVYGVINMLRKLQVDYPTDKMVVVFDAKGKTFRHQIYPDYKANRPPMPEDLRAQIEPLHSVVKAMGLPLISIEGCEADDVIGTLAARLAADGEQVLVSTGDKDLAQLVNDNVILVNTMSNVVMDRQGVEDKFGIPPECIIDYLALMGDASDNIPGVPKVGPKTAVKWLQEYGSLQNIMDKADEIKGKVGENLRASLQQLPMSKQLATIDQNIDLSLSEQDLLVQAADTECLKEWFSKLEFKSWLQDLPEMQNEAGAKVVAPEVRYETIFTQEALTRWLKKLNNAELFAFDTETTSLNYMQAEIVGISFAVTPGEAAYIPLAHDYVDAPQQLEREVVLDMVKPLLESKQSAVIGQHIKYDRNVLLSYGIHLDAVAHDTMLQSYILNSTATRHDMDSLAKKYLDVETVHYEDIAGKGAKQIPFSQVDIETASHYAAEDADITLRLHQALWKELAQDERLRSVYETIELPLLKVLSRIETTGVLIDTELLQQQSREFAKRMQEVEKEAYAVAEQPFNLASPKQIQEILFGKLGLPVIRKTAKGQPSTAEDVLQELAQQDHHLPQLLLEHRGLSKLKSTYTDKLPEQVNAKTGRVHTSYHQAVASTGRLSSTDPNLQNIPIRNENGRRIRQAFIAGKGNKLLAADYSQIELRIMAHLSQDKGLLDAFAQGLDIHRATAAEVFGLQPDQVAAEQRRAAKAINFGLIYGMSAFGLAKQLGISRGEAQQYVDLYFERYPGVLEYMESTKQKARDQGYVETVYGRRLYLPDIHSRNANVRQYAERTAINAPMQGSAADIIKLAMISVDAWLQADYPDVLMIMQVHDELVFEVPNAQLDEVKQGIIERMVSVADLAIPLEVDAGVGDNWDEAH